MTAHNPYREDVKAWIDTLQRSEPHDGRGKWGEAYDRLHVALQHARKLRRYSAIPAVVAAAAFVILLHGEVWDLDDVQMLFGMEALALLLLHFVLTKMFVVLAYEDQVQTLLRYYGAEDVALKEESLQ